MNLNFTFNVGGKTKAIVIDEDTLVSLAAKFAGANKEDVRFNSVDLEDENEDENGFKRGLTAFFNKDPQYAGAYLDGFKTNKNEPEKNTYYYLSISEIVRNSNALFSTYVYAGNSDTETDDWIAKANATDRDESDESRKIVYVDAFNACATAARNSNALDAGTEVEFQKERRNNND